MAWRFVFLFSFFFFCQHNFLGISLIFLVGLAATQIGLWAFAEYYVITEENRSQAIAIDLVLVALTGFVLIAPYSFVDGVFAMEIAGKSAPAVAGILFPLFLAHNPCIC